MINKFSIDLNHGFKINKGTLSGGAYPFVVNYLLVGGGAGATSVNDIYHPYYYAGGDGGAVVQSTLPFTSGNTYTITVGVGGGGGGLPGNNTNNTTQIAGSGQPSQIALGASVLATASGGNPNSLGISYGGSGAAGAGGAGGAPVVNTRGGNGGNGLTSSITGSSVYYAGGGAGIINLQIPPFRSTGTAGQGSYGAGATATNVGASQQPSGNSGVVILSIPTSSYSGKTTGSPTITTSGSNTILTYTGSGTYIS
jgi:hypothetical protein